MPSSRPAHDPLGRSGVGNVYVRDPCRPLPLGRAGRSSTRKLAQRGCPVQVDCMQPPWARPCPPSLPPPGQLVPWAGRLPVGTQRGLSGQARGPFRAWQEGRMERNSRWNVGSRDCPAWARICQTRKKKKGSVRPLPQHRCLP